MAQARRDARMLLDGLRGVHPSPLLPRLAGHAMARRAEQHAARDTHAQPVVQPAPPPVAAPAPAPARQASAVARVRIGGCAHEVTVQPDQTILEATLAAGLPMPFSCTVGGCGACKVALRAGAVDLEEPNCLTDAEREAGDVLTCVGRPLGPITIEVGAE
jgi:ferredoxin